MKMKGRTANIIRDRIVKIIYESGERTSTEIFSKMKFDDYKDLPKEYQIPQIMRHEYFYKAGTSKIIGHHYSVTRWGLSNQGKDRYEQLSN